MVLLWRLCKHLRHFSVHVYVELQRSYTLRNLYKWMRQMHCHCHVVFEWNNRNIALVSGDSFDTSILSDKMTRNVLLFVLWSKTNISHIIGFYNYTTSSVTVFNHLSRCWIISNVTRNAYAVCNVHSCSKQSWWFRPCVYMLAVGCWLLADKQNLHLRCAHSATTVVLPHNLDCWASDQRRNSCIMHIEVHVDYRMVFVYLRTFRFARTLHMQLI